MKTSTQQKTQLKCQKCGYSFDYSGDKYIVPCRNCRANVKNPNATFKPKDV